MVNGSESFIVLHVLGACGFKLGLNSFVNWYDMIQVHACRDVTLSVRCQKKIVSWDLDQKWACLCSMALRPDY